MVGKQLPDGLYTVMDLDIQACACNGGVEALEVVLIVTNTGHEHTRCSSLTYSALAGSLCSFCQGKSVHNAMLVCCVCWAIVGGKLLPDRLYTVRDLQHVVVCGLCVYNTVLGVV
jgi:hypothetical protein